MYSGLLAGLCELVWGSLQSYFCYVVGDWTPGVHILGQLPPNCNVCLPRKCLGKRWDCKCILIHRSHWISFFFLILKETQPYYVGVAWNSAMWPRIIYQVLICCQVSYSAQDRHSLPLTEDCLLQSIKISSSRWYMSLKPNAQEISAFETSLNCIVDFRPARATQTISPKRRGGVLLFVLDKMSINDSVFCVLVFCLHVCLWGSQICWS